MKGDNILLTRIDNRLVHGQVGVTWTKTLNVNLIIVADDEVAANDLQKSLMSVTAKSSGVGIRFFTLQHTADVIDRAAPSQHIFLVVKTPAEARKLVELGVHLKDVNVGNMHFSEGKREITKKVYVDDKDWEDLQFLVASGSNVYCQDIPGKEKHEITKDS
jgi:PTS system galactosamine-specific IIB component